jgi:hypothetical protein
MLPSIAPSMRASKRETSDFSLGQWDSEKWTIPALVASTGNI